MLAISLQLPFDNVPCFRSVIEVVQSNYPQGNFSVCCSLHAKWTPTLVLVCIWWKIWTNFSDFSRNISIELNYIEFIYVSFIHRTVQCIQRYSICSEIDFFSLLVWTMVTWNHSFFMSICSTAILLYSTQTKMKRRMKKKKHETHTEPLKFQLFIENHGRFIIGKCFNGGYKNPLLPQTKPKRDEKKKIDQTFLKQ